MHPIRSRPLLALAALCLVASACNPARTDPGGGAGAGTGSPSQAAASVDPKAISATLDVWGFGTDNALAKARIDLFQKAYPNIKLRFTPGGFDEQKFLSSVASGSPPDVIHIGRSDLSSYAARGAILELDDRIKNAGVNLTDFYDAAVKQVQLDGKTYGMPQFNNMLLAYVNNKALKDAGLTIDDIDFSDWEKLRVANEKMSKVEGNKVTRVGVDVRMPEKFPWWVAANGGRIVSDDGTEAQLDSPEVIQTVNLAADMRKKIGGEQKYKAFTGAWDVFGKKNPIAADQVGVFLEEQWYLNVLGETSPDADFTVVPLRNKQGEPMTFAAGNAFAIPKGSDSPDAAWEFVKFMSSEEQWVEAAKAAKADREGEGLVYTGTYSGNKKADARILAEVYKPSGKKPFDEGVEVIRSMLDHTVSVPANAAGKEIADAYVAAVNKALLGQQSAEEAMKAADEAAQKALDRAKGS